MRLSVDSTFAGPEVYGRLQLVENGTNIYLGAGAGVRPFAFQYSSFPLGLSAVAGFEIRIGNVGVFLEYAPVIPISGLAANEGALGDLLAGILHLRAGLIYHF